MKIENLVKDCLMDVEWYCSYLYNWELHHQEDKQTNDDLNKNRGSLKILTDGVNIVHVLKSKHVSEIPEDVKIQFDESSLEMMKELMNKDFYFCMVLKHNSQEPIFPNEIWLTYEAAVECCIKYL